MRSIADEGREDRLEMLSTQTKGLELQARGINTLETLARQQAEQAKDDLALRREKLELHRAQQATSIDVQETCDRLTRLEEATGNLRSTTADIKGSVDELKTLLQAIAAYVAQNLLKLVLIF